MTFTGIPVGASNWDVPLNAALFDLQDRIDTATEGRVNVKDPKYGAKGDGLTDDTAAVQAAIDAGGITFFPPGVYLVRTLKAKLGMVLQGVTRSAYAYRVPATQSSTLKLMNGVNGHLIHAPDGVNNVQISNLAFDGNKANNTAGDLIHLDDAPAQDTSWHIYDCYFDNSPRDGVHVGYGRQAIKMSRTWVMRAANNGVTMNGADSGLESCLIGLSGQDAVQVGAWVTHLSQCDIWSSGRNGVNSTKGAFSVTLTGCGIDRHKQEGLVVGGGTVTVIGCVFHSNSQHADGAFPHISVTGGSLSLSATLFGTSAATAFPSHCVGITGGALYEVGNQLYPGSTTAGYVSDPTKVVNAFTGSVGIDAASQLNIGGSPSTSSVAIQRTNVYDEAYSSRVPGNTVPRFSMNADGLHQWSNGIAPADVHVNRGGPNRLDLNLADLRVGTAGRGLQIAEGTNAKMGRAKLVGGTVVVKTTAVTAGSEIFLTTQAPGGTPGATWVSARTAGTGFTIQSGSATDTSTVAWLIVEPA